MTSTTNWGLTLIETGQKDKGPTINDNFVALDSAPKYMGEATTAPTAACPPGSTYFNTSTNKLMVKKSNSTWAAVA